MSYLARLRKAETPSIGAANAAKRPFDSKDSSDPGHFTDNAPPFDSKDSSDGGRFQDLSGINPSLLKAADLPPKEHNLPKWCQVDCDRYSPLEREQRDSLPGCFREDDRGGWVWSRLDKLNACPVIPEGLPPLPAWCSRQCRHYHATLKGELLVERCHWRDETGRHWLRVRIEQLRRCPMKAHKNSCKNK